MKNKFIVTIVAASALLTPHTAKADAPLRANATPWEDRIANASGNPPSGGSTALFNLGGLAGVCNTLPPVLAPDGHQITLAEWNAVKGTSSVKCMPHGTHVVAHLSGLIPNGVYSMWVMPFHSPGFTPTLENIAGVGAAGSGDGNQNVLVASSAGTAELTLFQPAGNLSLFGSVGPCLTDQFEFLLLGAYHIDGQTHGPTPGPSCDYLEAFSFDFKP